MKKRIFIMGILIMISGCGASGAHKDGRGDWAEELYVPRQEETEDSALYEPEMIGMDQEETDEVSGKLFAMSAGRSTRQAWQKERMGRRLTGSA